MHANDVARQFLEVGRCDGSVFAISHRSSRIHSAEPQKIQDRAADPFAQYEIISAKYKPRDERSGGRRQALTMTPWLRGSVPCGREVV
jgi:hypothetical protein